MEENKPRQIDMSHFCHIGDNRRYRRTTPWVQGGWRYATDGIICMRMPSQESDTSPSSDGVPFPPAPDLFEKFEAAKCIMPWPKESPIHRATEKCPACYGEGTINDVTVYRDGEDNTGNLVDVDEDLRRCPMCSGIGTAELDIHRVVGNHHIGIIYDRLVCLLPDVMYEAGIATKPLRFVFDGGQGVVMGLRK